MFDATFVDRKTKDNNLLCVLGSGWEPQMTCQINQKIWVMIKKIRRRENMDFCTQSVLFVRFSANLCVVDHFLKISKNDSNYLREKHHWWNWSYP